MSIDNGHGHYTDFEETSYYTIGVRQRYAPAASPYVAYIIQLHNCIYSETAVRYLRREKDRLERDNEDMKPLILVAHQFCGNALAQFNDTVRHLKVINSKHSNLLNNIPLCFACSVGYFLILISCDIGNRAYL